VVRVSFSRERIRSNLPISSGLVPRAAAVAPICVETDSRTEWVFGLVAGDAATIFYRPANQPHRAWIETGNRISAFEETHDSPSHRKGRIYLYLQLSRLGTDYPPLMAHLREHGVWRSYATWTIHLDAGFRLVSSLGRPLNQTARVWIETHNAVHPGPEGWFTGKTNQPNGHSALTPA
jgi:hypothetical protein